MDTTLDISLCEPTPKKRVGNDGSSFNSLQHLFDFHLPSHSQHLLSEISTLQQRLALGKQGENNSCSLPGFLESTLTEGDHADKLVSLDNCVERLLHLVHNRSGDGKTHLCLLAAEQRVELSVVVSLFNAVKEKQSGTVTDVADRLMKEDLPLEVLWQLHVNDIMPFQTYFERYSCVRDQGRCAQMTEQLVHLCTTSLERAICCNILSAVCSYLVKTGFPEKKSENALLRKVCIGILDGVTRGLLDRHMSDTELVLHTELCSNAVDVSPLCFKKFCTHTISLIMSHCPNMKVSEALEKQAEWKSGKIPDNFKTFFKQLLVPFESVEVVEMLRRILEKQEVNWQTLLSFLATFLVCFPSAATDVQEHSSGLLAESLEEGDMENTIVAFLLVRQSCAEGAHVFPPYPQWFQETFGEISKSPSGSKKAFTFLMKFLTDLVPFEPADVLKVHILRPPAVPGKCRELWTDYTLLAKTRLADLKVPLEESNTAIFADAGPSTNQVCPGIQDVEKAVAVFESSGKLPTTVMEASIFRKPYFIGKFLPALLLPRHLPDTADSRMKFIEALKAAGKIPSSLYARYQEDCKKETRQLLEGVFEVEEEDDVEEMMMGPLEQLSHRLKQFTTVVTSSNTKPKVSEMVSVISEKIETVVGVTQDSSVSTGCCTVVKMCQPSLSSAHVQVVDEVLNCVCQALHSCTNSQEQSWLEQLVRMLSQHTVLHPTLFTRLLTLVSSSKSAMLSTHHVEGIAVFVFHLVNSMSLFPPVVVKWHDANTTDNSDVPFLLRFLGFLPVGTETEMIFTHSLLTYYIKTAFVHLNNSAVDSSPTNVILPRRLIVLFCLLNWRLLPETQPFRPLSSSPSSSSLPLLQQPPVKVQKRKADGETGHGYTQSVAAALYSSNKFQEVLATSPPSLQDWAQFELGVVSSLDPLSPLHRQTYHMAMMSHFTASGVDGDSKKSSLSHCCTVLMETLVAALSSRCKTTAADRCKRCQQSSQTNVPNPPVNPEAVSVLLALLAKLVQNLPASSPSCASDDDDDDDDAPWLLQQVTSLLTPDTHDKVVVPHAVLRVVLSCPPYLLFTSCISQKPSDKGLARTLSLLQKFLVKTATQGGVLSLDVICHLLQGYITVVDNCDDRSVMKVFEEHPLIILSACVHWRSVCVLVPSQTLTLPPWDKLAVYLDAVDRFCEEGRLVTTPVACDPLYLAASVFASLEHRTWAFDAQLRQQLLSHLLQSSPQAVGYLSQLLLISLADQPDEFSSLPQKTEVCAQWLSEMWEQCPHLICTVAEDDQAEFRELRSSLMCVDQQTLMDLAILRCVSRLTPDRVVGEKGVVPAVVHLFAQLCQRVEDTQSSSQTGEVTWLMELSNTVLTLVTLAPLHSLLTISADEAKQCGLEIFRVHQQRVANRS